MPLFLEFLVQISWYHLILCTDAFSPVHKSIMSEWRAHMSRFGCCISSKQHGSPDQGIMVAMHSSISKTISVCCIFSWCSSQKSMLKSVRGWLPLWLVASVNVSLMNKGLGGDHNPFGALGNPVWHRLVIPCVWCTVMGLWEGHRIFQICGGNSCWFARLENIL